MISLYRNKQCPYCKKSFSIDFGKYISDEYGGVIVETDERSMGVHTTYHINVEYSCTYCDNIIKFNGRVFEYPEGIKNTDDEGLEPKKIYE